jgi:hypothetical protein
VNEDRDLFDRKYNKYSLRYCKNQKPLLELVTKIGTNLTIQWT